MRTPEGVAFHMTLAGPARRALAAVVDLFVVSLASTIASWLVTLLLGWSLDWAAAAQTLLFFILSTGYGIAMEWGWKGRTLGKRLLRLRVVDFDGHRLTAAQIIVRNLLRPVDLLPVFYFVGGAALFLGGRSQRLGDMAAGTTVVWEPEPKPFDLAGLEEVKYNSLRAVPHVTARLRHRLDPGEIAVALEAVRRAGNFSPEGRVAVFAALASRLKEVQTFPPGVVEGLTDEQLVRGVVDTLR